MALGQSAKNMKISSKNGCHGNNFDWSMPKTIDGVDIVRVYFLTKFANSIIRFSLWQQIICKNLNKMVEKATIFNRSSQPLWQVCKSLGYIFSPILAEIQSRGFKVMGQGKVFDYISINQWDYTDENSRIQTTFYLSYHWWGFSLFFNLLLIWPKDRESLLNWCLGMCNNKSLKIL